MMTPAMRILTALDCGLLTVDEALLLLGRATAAVKRPVGPGRIRALPPGPPTLPSYFDPAACQPVR